jgi:hypothetical protein
VEAVRHRGRRCGNSVQGILADCIAASVREDDPSAPMDIVPQVFVGTVKYIDYGTEDMDWGNIFLPFLVKKGSTSIMNENCEE